MNRRRIRQLLTACLSLGAAIASADNTLTLHANEISTQIEPQDQRDTQTRLPSLDVSLLASFNCPQDAQAHSITVSVADSHKRYGPDEIADAEILEISVTVPAAQIAPVSLSNFCVDEAPINEVSLLLHSVATAQVSLRCRNQSDTSVHFASTALPLRLFCKARENQVSSADR